MTCIADNEVLVVGGSLSGLTFALACANHGLRTRVLERVNGRYRNGGALRLDRDALMRVVGIRSPSAVELASFPVLTGSRQAASWYAIHDWLRTQATRRSEITFKGGITILEVVQADAQGTVVTIEGKRINAPVIVGADGYRSVVRAAISPEDFYSKYAGYLLWRGLVPEADLPGDTRWPPNHVGFTGATPSGFCLSAFPVAGVDGSLEPGQRLINFVWYDPTREPLLRELGCLSDEGNVLCSLARESVPEPVREDLQRRARLIWPEPWRTFVLHALDRREVFGTPIAEYRPERLQRGRLAILGDAAHVISPVSGMGFVAGVLDAEAMARNLAHTLQTGLELHLGLKAYEAERLQEAQSLVAASVTWSRTYLRNMVNSRK